MGVEWWSDNILHSAPVDRIPLEETIPAIDEFYVYITPQTNPDSQPRSVPALELHSRAASSVGVMTPFQRSQHRKQFRRKADKKNRLTIYSNR